MIELIKSIFSQNRGAKLLSIVAAFVVWFGVSASEQRAGNFPGGIPVAVSNVPDGLVATLDQSEVKVSLLADRLVWQRFTANSFVATVDLTGATSGVVDRPVIVTSQIPGVEITRVSPASVLVRLEPLARKDVPVSLRLTGQPAEGFAAGETIAEPDTVTISGPQSILDQITEVTGVLDLGDHRSDFEESVKLVATVAGEDLSNVLIEPSSILAKIPIARAGNVKTVAVKISTSNNTPSGFTLDSLASTPAVVNITGQAALLSSIQFVETEPIDLSEIEGETEVSVGLVVPDGVKIVEQITEVKVVVVTEEITNKKTISLNLTVTEVTPGLSITSTTPDSIAVEVIGPASTVNSLTQADLKLEIPFTAGLGEGVHKLQIFPEYVNLPDGLEVVSIKPAEITVEVSK